MLVTVGHYTNTIPLGGGEGGGLASTAPYIVDPMFFFIPSFPTDSQQAKGAAPGGRRGGAHERIQILGFRVLGF